MFKVKMKVRICKSGEITLLITIFKDALLKLLQIILLEIVKHENGGLLLYRDTHVV